MTDRDQKQAEFFRLAAETGDPALGPPPHDPDCDLTPHGRALVAELRAELQARVPSPHPVTVVTQRPSELPSVFDSQSRSTGLEFVPLPTYYRRAVGPLPPCPGCAFEAEKARRGS